MPSNLGDPQPDKDPQDRRPGDEMANPLDPPLRLPPPPPTDAGARDERGAEPDDDDAEDVPLSELGDQAALALLMTGIRHENLRIQERNREKGDPGPPVSRELLMRFVNAPTELEPDVYSEVGRLITQYDAWFEAYDEITRDVGRPHE